MKKFVIASLLLCGAAGAGAEPYKLVNADGSELSQLCIAATTSRESLLQHAGSLGISTAELDTVRCNDMSLGRFAARYRAPAQPLAEAPTGFVLKQSDDSAVTALCIAATRSEQEYRRVKQTHFGAEPNLEAEVRCNGMPLRSFARKYGQPTLSISQR